MFKTIIAGAFLASACAVSAQAADISGLYNTGVAADGSVDSSNGVAEIHYVLNGGLPPAYSYFVGAWTNPTDAHWISPQADGGPGYTTNTYTLTFDLTGLDASSAVISGLFAADDKGSVSLNGGASIDTTGGYSGLTSFSFTSGFLDGLNTLIFTSVDTGGAPTGLIVSGLHGTADVASVPEPASWAMMIGGFGLVGGTLRRRRETLAHA